MACPACNRPMAPSESVCRSCGTRLAAPVPSPNEQTALLREQTRIMRQRELEQNRLANYGIVWLVLVIVAALCWPAYDAYKAKEAQDEKAAAVLPSNAAYSGSTVTTSPAADQEPGTETTKTAREEAPNTPDLDQQLMSAISQKDEKKVKRLLASGASPNASWDSNGMSALAAAATGGDLRIVKLLVTKGADTHAVDSTFGWTALQFAQNEVTSEEEDGENSNAEKAIVAYLEERS